MPSVCTEGWTACHNAAAGFCVLFVVAKRRKMTAGRKQSGPTSKGLKRNLKKFARVLRLKPLYQEERASVFKDRWAAIASCLDEGDASFIDIGCNMGHFTAAAARHGLFAIGVDPMEEAISRARRLHRKVPGCGFVFLDVNLETVRLIPSVDVMLCLSVHHYWNRAHGEEGAWQIIGDLARRSRKFFFEPASSHGRYGADVPPFRENDEESIAAYVRNGFARVAPGRKVAHVKTTSSINTESFRSMFLVSPP
jgi:SAM-dependent methyltransferase